MACLLIILVIVVMVVLLAVSELRCLHRHEFEYWTNNSFFHRLQRLYFRCRYYDHRSAESNAFSSHRSPYGWP